MQTGCLGSLNENAFHVGNLPSFFRDCFLRLPLWRLRRTFLMHRAHFRAQVHYACAAATPLRMWERWAA
jgi:hypothetical protein